MIWCKRSSPFSDANRYLGTFEYVFVFSNGKPASVNLLHDKPNVYGGHPINGTERKKNGLGKKFDRGNDVKAMGKRLNWWLINENKANKTGHPAVMPALLAEGHILSWSNPRDIVLVPYCGSGTTGIACISHGRKFIGIEIERKYFDIACERIEAAHAQGRLFA